MLCQSGNFWVSGTNNWGLLLIFYDFTCLISFEFGKGHMISFFTPFKPSIIKLLFLMLSSINVFIFAFVFLICFSFYWVLLFIQVKLVFKPQNLSFYRYMRYPLLSLSNFLSYLIATGMTTAHYYETILS